MKNHTDITILLDATGSMHNIQDDVVGGINEFIQDQKSAGSNASLTLVLFNERFPCHIIYDAVPIDQAGEFTTYCPMFSTPLLDSMGNMITKTGKRLADMPEDDRPDKVLFVVYTDGLDNISIEYTKEKIKSMVVEQQEKHNWIFMFMGADIDAIHEGASCGVPLYSTVNTSKNRLSHGIKLCSSKIGIFRESNDSTVLCFTDDERDELSQPTKLSVDEQIAL
jgi:hypothetical protein